MTESERRSSETGVVGKLAERGEEAMNRLMDELGRNSRVTEALTRGLAAKGMLDAASRTALVQFGLAPAQDVRELRTRVHELERRLEKLESGSKGEEKPAARRTRPRKALPKEASPDTSPEAPRTRRSTAARTTGTPASEGRAPGAPAARRRTEPA